MGNSPNSAVIADFNHDGKRDLVAAGAGNSSVSVRLGNGDGTFKPHKEYGDANGSYAVAAGDLNGDGNVDLAAVSILVNTVTVLLGDGAGSFNYRGYYGTGDFPYSVAMGDLNGDNKPDLAVGNYGASSVSLLLNTNGATLAVPQSPVGTEGSQLQLSASPNPATAGVNLRFTLAVAERVDAEVFDVSGRRVRSLMRGERLRAGAQSVAWDRNDDRGRSLAGGVYLVRIRAGNTSALTRVLLLK